MVQANRNFPGLPELGRTDCAHAPRPRAAGQSDDPKDDWPGVLYRRAFSLRGDCERIGLYDCNMFIMKTVAFQQGEICQ
jgi:hypothetical protein